MVEHRAREISEYRRLISIKENIFGKKRGGIEVVRVLKKVRKG